MKEQGQGAAQKGQDSKSALGESKDSIIPYASLEMDKVDLIA